MIINDIPPIMTDDRFVALDIEMFNQVEGKLHRPIGDFACISICIDGKTVYQVYEEQQITAALKAIDKGTWVIHNALYDLRQLLRYTKIKPRFIWDTMLVDQAMYGGYYRTFSLADLARRWLQIRMPKEERKKFSTKTAMTASMKKYAANDALQTLHIANKQYGTFHNDPAFNAYILIDEPSIWPILDMEGPLVDKDGWKGMVDGFIKKAHEIQDGLGFNVKSTQQCKKALAEIGIHLESTKAEVLESLKGNKLAETILEGRLYRDASSKYGLKWVEENVEEDGRVYSAWRITGAETGRMSSADPNLQNIPHKKIPEYRKRFIAPPGRIIMVYDVHQQEPCILAYESQDTELLRAIRAGEDLHLTVARAVFNDQTIKKEDPRRFTGKTINLGTSYGLSVFGLARRLNIDEDQAEKFLNQYFARFRGVAMWIHQKRSSAQQKGYISTISGRRVYINPHDYQWQNNAINAPIQGGAADFTKMWVRKIWESSRKAKIEYPVKMIVHDEVVLETEKGNKKPVHELVQKAFDSTAATLFKGVPFTVEGEAGRSWAAKDMKEEAYVE